MNEFEKISDEVNGELKYESSQESVIEWVGNAKDAKATVTFPKGRYASKIERLAKEHPEEVVVRYRNKDGSLVATIPVSYVKISAKRAGREMTEDEIEAARERLREYHEKRKQEMSSTKNSINK